MKLPIAFSIFAFAIGMGWQAFAGPAPVSGGAAGFTTEPINPSPMSTSTSNGAATAAGTTYGAAGSSNGVSAPSSAPAGTSGGNNTDVTDDSLSRSSTNEGLENGAMMRDDGPLHFKTQPKEKIQEVDSLKNLHSSGTDPKFQTSFLNSGAASIQSISAKANAASEPADNGDPRFNKKHPSFTADKTDEPKKAAPDSSPSPAPSPSASPAAKDSGGTKQ